MALFDISPLSKSGGYPSNWGSEFIHGGSVVNSLVGWAIFPAHKIYGYSKQWWA